MAMEALLLLVPSCSRSIVALSTSDGGSDVADASGPAPACSPRVGAPAAVGPLPTSSQVGYQRLETTGFIHFGLETFDGSEQGNSAVDAPSIFNPSNLDARQWVAAFKSAGIRQVMLTAKHGTGFCLWPSQYTDYSVKSSPWEGGKGDVVKEFTDAMHAEGLDVGLFLSPWDQHYPSSSPGYEGYFRNLLTELLTLYGPVAQIQFDGYNAPTSNVNWKSVFEYIKQLQRDTLVWAGPEIATTGVDIRWSGTQNGTAPRTTASVADPPGGGTGKIWYPAEAPASVRFPNWFWHSGENLVSLTTLESYYLKTVGDNTTLRLNVPPSTTGQLDATDVALLGDFGAWYASLYKTSLVKSASATADSTWAAAGFDAAKAVDDDICTYWAAASGAKSGRLEVTPTAPVTFSLISIREPIELGERTTAYHVEIKQNGTWNKAPTDTSGTQIQGTVIGQRQLWQLGPTTAEAVALSIDGASDVPAIAELGLY